MKSLQQRLEVTERRLRLCYEQKASDLTQVEERLVADNAKLRVRVQLCCRFKYYIFDKISLSRYHAAKRYVPPIAVGQAVSTVQPPSEC